MADLLKRYKTEIMPKLQKELQTANMYAVPRLTKIVINIGIKDAVLDKKLVEKMSQVMSQISGQKPRVNRAKKSIATFKLREGDPIGLSVTLRGKRMYAFLDRLISIVLPRIKDFRGLEVDNFDGRGNFALGLREYTVFPEIDLAGVEKMQGLEIIIVTTAKYDKEGLALLKAFGMPFQKVKS